MIGIQPDPHGLAEEILRYPSVCSTVGAIKWIEAADGRVDTWLEICAPVSARRLLLARCSTAPGRRGSASLRGQVAPSAAITAVPEARWSRSLPGLLVIEDHIRQPSDVARAIAAGSIAATVVLESLLAEDHARLIAGATPAQRLSEPATSTAAGKWGCFSSSSSGC